MWLRLWLSTHYQAKVIKSWFYALMWQIWCILRAVWTSGQIWSFKIMVRLVFLPVRMCLILLGMKAYKVLVGKFPHFWDQTTRYERGKTKINSKLKNNLNTDFKSVIKPDKTSWIVCSICTGLWIRLDWWDMSHPLL